MILFKLFEQIFDYLITALRKMCEIQEILFEVTIFYQSALTLHLMETIILWHLL